MQKLRTHYDNLKVSRDAPIEVIQAAYRSLARKHHPDRSGSTPESDKVMKIINASYEILSDPAKRAEHDRWIAEQTSGRGSLDGTTDGNRSPRGDQTGQRQRDSRGVRTRRPWNVVDVMLAVGYFVSALFILRIPGLRMVGIGMVIAGAIYIQIRNRKG